jgi:hypothetical protein
MQRTSGCRAENLHREFKFKLALLDAANIKTLYLTASMAFQIFVVRVVSSSFNESDMLIISTFTSMARLIACVVG